MSTTKEIILPQEGTGYAGESLPVSTDTGCSSYSGEGKVYSTGSVPHPEGHDSQPTTQCVHNEYDDVAPELEMTTKIGGSRQPRDKQGRFTRRAKISQLASEVLALAEDRSDKVILHSEHTTALIQAQGADDAEVRECAVDTIKSSQTSGEHTQIHGRFWKELPAKCGERVSLPRENESSSVDTSCDEVSLTPTVSNSKAVRGHVTTGTYIDFAKSRAELKKRREEYQMEVEQEVAKKMVKVRKNTARLARPDRESNEPVDLNQLMTDSIDVVFEVAKRSKNMKGTLMRDLKDAATAFRDVANILQHRNIPEEMAKLRENNAQLQTEMAELRKELVKLKANSLQASSHHDTEEAPVITSASTSKRRTTKGASTLKDTNFARHKEGLLPEKRTRPSAVVENIKLVDNGPESVTAGSLTKDPKKTKRKKKRKGKKEVNTHEATRLHELLPAQTLEEGWSKVVKKKGKKENAKAPPTEGPQAARQEGLHQAKNAAKLRPPRSAAVVITLQPEAEKRGLTYRDVLAEAKCKIDLAALGIPALRFRRAATGARILEIPGATSSDKADSLAKKLREALNQNDIKVARPTKCAELRISGLDDSVSAEEVVSAVARNGGCQADYVKSGTIRQGPSGLGAVWVRCPIAAAKKLADSGRLLVGWVSAQVRLLEPRVMRCYRCLTAGHVQANCVSEVDRRTECYRCGQPGHKAARCNAKAHCNICAAINKPAEHRLGSINCAAPRSKGKGIATVAKRPQQRIHPIANIETNGAEMVPTESG